MPSLHRVKENHTKEMLQVGVFCSSNFSLLDLQGAIMSSTIPSKFSGKDEQGGHRQGVGGGESEGMGFCRGGEGGSSRIQGGPLRCCSSGLRSTKAHFFRGFPVGCGMALQLYLYCRQFTDHHKYYILELCFNSVGLFVRRWSLMIFHWLFCTQ